jgi:hypothetical protein
MEKSEYAFKPEWICFSCGMRWKNKLALYAHLQHCYWHSQFKDRIEEAPFYKPTPYRQLRYYWRNKNKILGKLRRKRKQEKESGRFVPKSMRGS